jgi:hypothetical protein
MHQQVKRVEGIRWVEYARRSMQRLGFLKWVSILASPSRAQTLETLTRAFYLGVTKEVSVPKEKRESLDAYVLLHQQRTEHPGLAQIQDLYLSDPLLPSHSGSITGDLEKAGYRHAVYVEMPKWATQLRLLREQNYTLTDRGKVLLIVGGVKADDFSAWSPRNPLLLNVAERYVSLYSLLDADGDFLSALYRRLLPTQTFTRADAGLGTLEALEELRGGRLKHPSVGRMQELRRKIDRTVDAIRKQRQGGLGPRESLATPRIEPLVDCGILRKPDPDRYEYSFTDWGRLFLNALVSAESVGAFLDNGFSSAFATLTGQSVNHELPPLSIFEESYTQLRSGLGYVSLRELALCSIANLLYSPGASLFEIAAAENLVRKAAGEGTRSVRLALGRTGETTQVRMDMRALARDNT